MIKIPHPGRFFIHITNPKEALLPGELNMYKDAEKTFKAQFKYDNDVKKVLIDDRSVGISISDPGSGKQYTYSIPSGNKGKETIEK